MPPTAPPRSKPRVALAKLLLVVGGAALADGGAQLLGARPETIDPSIATGGLGADAFGRFAYPRGYFVAHETRGFDIAPDAPPVDFEFADGHTTVFSNRYGCFDRTTSFEGPYVLLLGDSFTWGYADYEVKWGTLLEQRLGVPVAKCGVTHTGQRHQLEKGRDVVAAIGHAPRIVVVAHYLNDPQDDYLFPRATVVEGYLADATILEGGAPRRFTRAELLERYRRWASGDTTQKNPGRDFDPPSALERRSTIFAALRRGRRALEARGDRARRYGARTEDECAADAREANEDAMAAIKVWTLSIGAELRVLLVPPKIMTDPYAPARRYLDQVRIAYLDLLPRFEAAPGGGARLFWPRDSHLSPEGNRLVADLVAAWLAPALRGAP